MKLLLPLSALMVGAMASYGMDGPASGGTKGEMSKAPQAQGKQTQDQQYGAGQQQSGQQQYGAGQQQSGQQQSGQQQYGAGQQQGGQMSKGDGKKDVKKDDKKKNNAAAADIKVNVQVKVIDQSWGNNEKYQKYNEPAQSQKTHEITVGGGTNLIYSPETINAEINDIVVFKFLEKNHTVTQSSFDKPCVKNPKGVDSGFMPNNGTKNPAPWYKFQVSSKDPIWFYCKQKTGTHCGKGMVFSINPKPEKSHEQYKAKAKEQNGTADAVPAPPPPPPASTTILVTPSTPAPTAAPAPAPPAPAAPAPPPVVVQGTGNQCDCSCLCGGGSAPGAYGGLNGQIPVSWGKKVSAPAAPAAPAPAAPAPAPPPPAPAAPAPPAPDAPAPPPPSGGDQPAATGIQGGDSPIATGG